MHFPRLTQFREVGLGILIVLSTALTVDLAASTKTARTAKIPPAPASVKSYGNLPLVFEPNVGQTDERVRFLARSGGMVSFFTDTETVMVLNHAVVRMKLENARLGRKPMGQEKLPGISNYFIGNDPSHWHTDVPHFARVEYPGAYPGIDLVWYGNQRNLEYDFVVSPGADPRQIQVAYEDADSLEVQANGDLLIRTAAGDVRQQKPRVYQELGGHQVEVAAQYSITSRHAVGFEIARYDPKKPLRIDPLVLGYSTYLGGSGLDGASGIAVDGSGSAYVTGETSSTDFPTQSPYQPTNASTGAYDVFVTKVTPAGNALVYSTYLGGLGSESGNAIAVDGTGSAYIAGTTSSGNFPTVSAFQPAYKGFLSNAFVAKLNPAGNGLVYSTYLGGTITDSAAGIAVDAAGSAYVTGNTNSKDFPTQSPFQSALQGSGTAAFVTKFTPSGSALVYSTYLSGNTAEEGTAIAVDASGSAYVTGVTDSTNFPTKSPFQPALQGRADAFITKFTPAGTGLVYSTFLGGTSIDSGQGIALDSTGAAYVTGATQSSDFPTQSPFQATNHTTAASKAPEDVFVAKLSPAGTSLVYSTYLGGSTTDDAYAIAVDKTGAAVIAGFTISTDFPTQAPIQTTFKTQAAFVARLTPTGSSLDYSTYLGGGFGDAATAVALDSTGAAYIAGSTSDTAFPTQTPLQATNHGSPDAFVAKMVFTGGASHPAFFSGEVSLGSGVYYLQLPNTNVFGYYNYQFFPVLYHYDLGFEYFLDANDGKGGAYLYDFTSGHWFYTSPSYPFPYLYDFTLQSILYYYPDTKNPGHYTTNPRSFYNFATGKVITI